MKPYLLEDTQELANRIRIMRYSVIASWTGLVLLLTYTSWAMTPEGARPLVIWLIQCGPLLLFLPGLWKGLIRAHLWLCFLILFYFIQGVLAAFRPDELIVGVLEIVFTLDLFVAATMYCRWEGARRRGLQQAA